ncbi:MAG TPA: CPBP family intramembrane glutamic endopeptidase [Edaphocola sp.]|nr:CPBP family intramembrane glutamic endopeptidase [Edaphocola sp.]
MRQRFRLEHFPQVVQFLVLLLLFFIGIMLQAGLISTFNNNMGDATKVLIIMVCTQIVGFLIPAWIYVKLIPRPLGAMLQFRPIDRKQDILWIVMLTAPTLAAVMGLSQIMMQLPFGDMAKQMQEQRNELEQAALQMQTIPQLLSRLLVMALLPAFCEEIFFRGLVQRFMLTFIKSPLPAIIISSILFAALHSSIYNLLPIVLAGTVLGYLYYKTGNIWNNIILHFLINGVQIVLNYFSTEDSGEERLSIAVAITLLVAGLALIIFILRAIAKGKPSYAATMRIPYHPPF